MFGDKDHWYTRLWGTKGMEIEKNEREPNEKIQSWNVTFKRRRKIDHAGVELELETPYFAYTVRVYDHRHWNDEEDRFMYPNEDFEKYLRNHDPDSYGIKTLKSWIKSQELGDELEEKYDVEVENLEELDSFQKADDEDLKKKVLISVFYNLFSHGYEQKI